MINTTAITNLYDSLTGAITAKLDTLYANDKIDAETYGKLLSQSLDEALKLSVTAIQQQEQIDKDNEIKTSQKLQIEQQTLAVGAEKQRTDAQTAQVIAESANVAKQGSLIDAQIIKMGKDSDIAAQEILVKQQQVLIAEAEVGIAQAKLANIPKEGLQLDAQTALTTQQKLNLVGEANNILIQGTLLNAQAGVATQQRANLEDELQTATIQRARLNQEINNLTAQKLQIDAQTAIAVQQKGNLVDELLTATAQRIKLAQEAANLVAQLTVIEEQGEAQRAQTMDTRSDGTTPIAGSVKSQKDLYAQQVISYQRSSQTSAAKVWVDSWVADSALQDSPSVPTGFTAANIGAVLTTLKTANGL